MRTGLNETAVASFEQVRAAAQQRVAELGHGMQWMTWGCPPHSAGAVCVFCGRELLIARTRQGLFHLDGDALGACVPSTFASLDVAGTTRQMV
ncbi:MAG TPA: hypothetical protein VKF37_15840 [Chloroflexota bacterium]|jgi:hypothetical protein|nr:hypothetical protein [Chloroflexota bacterium]